MPKNNRPGVKAQVEELDESELDDATDTDAELLDTLQADGPEAANDFLEDWTPPAQLQAPPPRPGFVQHWCRMSAGGRVDATQRNYNEQQGWRPRRIETINEEDRMRYPQARDPQLGDIITQGSLVLCEMPARKAAQRNAYYQRKHERQMESMVTNPLAQINESARAGIGPIKMVQKSKISTGKRNIAQAD